MYIEKEPQKPVQGLIEHRINRFARHGYTHTLTLKEINDIVNKYEDVVEVKIHSYTFPADWNDYDNDYVILELNISRKETDSEFALRIAQYNIDKEKYDKWYAQNEDEILQELKRQERRDKEIEEYEQQIKDLKDKLNKVRKT